MTPMDEPGEASQAQRKSSEANDEDDYGYILREQISEPGQPKFEIERDTDVGQFADDARARLQFVVDLECGSIYAKNMAKKLMGRPDWGYDIDNETMFYCSKVPWVIYDKDPDAFEGDEREARRVALLAAEVFEQRYADYNWDREDYDDFIWDHVKRMDDRLMALKCPGDIQTVDQMRYILYDESNLKDRAKRALKRINAGEPLTGEHDLLDDLTSILREVSDE